MPNADERPAVVDFGDAERQLRERRPVSDAAGPPSRGMDAWQQAVESRFGTLVVVLGALIGVMATGFGWI